ncbi:lipocalin family protein [uncultured Aquimarina sp.]|uniref:lipocalin family protein n=1 Tax=uncultured Aquimarina sp. TaxID=575652 RepID=UPI002634CDC6|nr:lipocalin family protein [uncultured Aquimarina sp.]
MKRTFLIIVLIVFTFGCKNDDESDNQNNEISIIGNWKLIDWYDDTPKDINNDGEESTDLFSQWNGCRKQSTLILSNDNTGKIVYNGGNNNPKCPPGFDTDDFFPTHPWTFDELNQTFTLMAYDYSDSYEIIELSSEILILKGSGFFTCCDSEISYYTGGYLKFERE